jgi:hypothetical protein
MEFVYFTMAGLLLYVASDWVLLRIEAMYGQLLPNRSVFFFAIIMFLSTVSFEAVQYFTSAPENPVQGVASEGGGPGTVGMAPTDSSTTDPVQMIPSK